MARRDVRNESMNDLQAKSTNTLALCPFCGGEADVIDYDDECWVAHQCANGTSVETNSYATEAEAIAAWNSRADYHGYEQAAIESWESIKAWNSRAERTCKQEERGWCTEGDHARVWLTCGHDCMVPTVQDLPNYCPNCGCKVVGE